MTPEGKVKLRVKELLREFKPRLWAHWPVQVGYGAPTLDCTGAYNGHAFAIETKAPGEDLTDRQQLTKQEMEDAGIRVFVIGRVAWSDGGKKLVYDGMLELEEWLQQHS
jgi:hypothetical protein